MQSEGCNRHCATCKTTVHDLSLLTIDDAERLLQSDGPLCVRAVVRSSGAVALKPSPSKATRRMVAALGASMSLATAACETGVVSPRMSIVGHLSAWDATKVEARSSDGRKHGGRIGKEGQFTIKNLFPGDYSVSFTDQCGRTHVVADVVEEVVACSAESAVWVGVIFGPGFCRKSELAQPWRGKRSPPIARRACQF